MKNEPPWLAQPLTNSAIDNTINIFIGDHIWVVNPVFIINIILVFSRNDSVET